MFPKLKQDRLALKINGKYVKLRRLGFRALAMIAGLRAVDADAAIDDMLERLSKAVDRISVNAGPKMHHAAGVKVHH